MKGIRRKSLTEQMALIPWVVYPQRVILGVFDDSYMSSCEKNCVPLARCYMLVELGNEVVKSPIIDFSHSLKAEERLAMVEEQRKIHEERMKMEEEKKKQKKIEQSIILGKKNSRPKLSFSIK